MQIMYRSTRSSELKVTASQAVLQGLAPDGGLFVPEKLPRLSGDWKALAGQSYQETALQIMSLLLTDYTQEELKNCIDRAYDSKFDIPQI